MSLPTISDPPPRRIVRLVALEADCSEQLALRAIVYGVDTIRVRAIRERVRRALEWIKADVDRVDFEPW